MSKFVLWFIEPLLGKSCSFWSSGRHRNLNFFFFCLQILPESKNFFNCQTPENTFLLFCL